MGSIALLVTSWVLGFSSISLLNKGKDYERPSEDHCVLVDNTWVINFHAWESAFFIAVLLDPEVPSNVRNCSGIPM